MRPQITWAIILMIALGSTLLATRIKINDNALDLLPAAAVKKDLHLLQRLGLVNRLIITLSLKDDDPQEEDISRLKEATRKVGKRLQTSRDFSNVVYTVPNKAGFQAYGSLSKWMPLLFEESELLSFSNKTSPEAIQNSFKEGFRLLNSPAGIGMARQFRQDPLGLTPLLLEKLGYLKIEYSLDLEDELFLSRDRKTTLIIAESTKQLTDSADAAYISSELAKIFREETGPELLPRIQGSLPHTLANVRTVKKDLSILLPLATILLFFLLLLTFRSARAFLVLAIPYLAAPTGIYLTYLVFSKISALALGFGIVLLGIAVDFAVHLYLGLAESDSKTTFLRHISTPILLATATTVSVFLVILFSDVPAHRQMATLALTGIIMAVVYSWFLVPLIAPARIPGNLNLLPPSFGRFSHSMPRVFVFCWVVFLTAGFFSLFSLKYNGDLRTLDAPAAEVQAAEKHFHDTFGGAGNAAFLVAAGSTMDQALAANYQVFRELQNLQISSFQSIAPLLPPLAVQQENLNRWQKFWAGKEDFPATFRKKADQFGFSENGFQPFFNTLAHPPTTPLLLESWPESLQTLLHSMIRKAPPTADGNSPFLVTTTVTLTERNYPALLKLDQANPNITLLANKKWRTQVENSLRHDILILSLTAGIIIAGITLLHFRKLKPTLAALAPVLSALSAMALYCTLTGKEMNMMHLLMAIMVIGLAVDYGIFTACSAQTSNSKASAKAISICALSSLSGFGVLSFAHHPALHSLGITVLIGIGAAWPTAILVSPALLGRQKSANGALP